MTGWILAVCLRIEAQTFRLETVSDSLSRLVLTTDSTCDRWDLPYPVYQFQVGDIDGDGSIDAMVGVIKKTRFHRDMGRRLFIFKNHRGRVRSLWMGSKLGGQLEDFRFVDGVVRALESTRDGKYVVSDYRWEEFGLIFAHFIEKNIKQKDQAYEKFLDNGIRPAD